MSCIFIVENQKFRSYTDCFSFGSFEYFKFLNDLSKMYKSLSGSAKLESYDYPASINILVNERGYFVVEGKIEKTYSINGVEAKNSHNFQLSFDQTYLERLSKKYMGINSDNWKKYFNLEG